MTDSHTNFDAGAFGVGAFSASGLVASALMAGIAELSNSSVDDYAGWTAQGLSAALVISEQRRAREMEEILSLRAENAALRREKREADYRACLNKQDAARAKLQARRSLG